MNAGTIVYVLIMIVAGLTIGLLQPLYPVFFEQIPPMVTLLAVGLLVDIALMGLALRGIGQPLAMQYRLIGFLAGFVILTLLPQIVAR